MIIRTDIMGNKINNIQRITSDNMQKTMQRLSTGLRINSASDDTAGLAISERLKSKINEDIQTKQNLADEMNLFSTKDGILQSITDQLQKARELSIKAQNGTNSTQDKQSIQNQVNQLLNSIDNLAKYSTFNGKNLLTTGTSLDGVNDYINFPNSPNLQFGTNDFSVSVDFKLNSFNFTANQVRQVIGMWDTTNVNGFEIQIFSNGTLEFGVKDGSHKVIDVSKAIQLNQPYKVDMVRKNGVVTAYINGKQVNGSITTGNESTTSPLTIGKEPNGSEFFDGYIRNVKIYNRALTSDDIQNHQMDLSTDDGVVGKWLDTQGTGTQVNDDSGNGLTGTMMNGATWGTYTAYLGLSNLDVTNSSSIQNIDNALNQISTERSQIGADQTRFQMRSSYTEESNIQLQQSNARISNADFAIETSNLTKDEVKQQLSIQMLKKNDANRENILSLLQG